VAGVPTPAARPATAQSGAVQLGLAMQRIRARMRAESTTSTGWTMSQLSTLARIANDGPTTASALAQAEHVRPQSIADIVATLKQDGLVVAEPDPHDRRKVLLRATPEGRDLIHQVSSSREAWLARAIEAVVGPDDRAHLDHAVDLLNRLAECDLGTPAARGWRL
jgi:DNA-binding MarR family transcriptional regulator